MTFIKNENGVVVLKVLSDEEGLIEAPNYVVCGMVEDGNGGYVNPPPTLPTSLEAWEQEMRLSDAALPRWAEDIIDALDAPTRDRIATETLTKWQDKKTKRAAKP